MMQRASSSERPARRAVAGEGEPRLAVGGEAGRADAEVVVLRDELGQLGRVGVRHEERADHLLFVLLPLFLAGQVVWLGVAKVVLGWPLRQVTRGWPPERQKVISRGRAGSECSSASPEPTRTATVARRLPCVVIAATLLKRDPAGLVTAVVQEAASRVEPLRLRYLARRADARDGGRSAARSASSVATSTCGGPLTRT